MENNKLRCEIIHDLLPSYIDGLTNDITNQAIEEHLESCETCRNILERMKEPEKEEQAEVSEKKIDYLKTTRKMTRKKIVISVFVSILLIACGLLAKFYLIGSPVRSELISCEVKQKEDTITVSGCLTDSALGITNVSKRVENGILTIDMNTVFASKFTENKFEAEYTTENSITQVRVGDRVVWDHGFDISYDTWKVYETRHEYIGDVSANLETVNALRMEEALGELNYELKTRYTSDTIYEWIITVEEMLPWEKENLLEKKMEGYAYVLLAMIDNLDRVVFEYTTEEGQQTLETNSADTWVYTGMNVKQDIENLADFQELMENVGLVDSFNNNAVSVKSYMSVTCETESEIIGMTLEYKIDNEWRGTMGIQIGEAQSIENNDIPFVFEIDAEVRDLETEEKMELSIVLTVTTADGATYRVTTPTEVEYDVGRMYEYKLVGSIDKGFYLK